LDFGTINLIVDFIKIHSYYYKYDLTTASLGTVSHRLLIGNLEFEIDIIYERIISNNPDLFKILLKLAFDISQLV
jgi:hypothetical protein